MSIIRFSSSPGDAGGGGDNADDGINLIKHGQTSAGSPPQPASSNKSEMNDGDNGADVIASRLQ